MGIFDLFRTILSRLEEDENVVRCRELVRIFVRGQDWPQIASMQDYLDSERAIDELVGIGEPSVVLLIDLLARHSDTTIGRKVIKALGNLKDSRAVRPLITLGESKVSGPYLGCIGEALEKIGREDGLKSGVYLRYAEDQRFKKEQEKEKQEEKRRKGELERKGKIRIQCEGCRVVYILGKDAAVLTDAQLAGDMLSVTVLGGGSRFISSPERPDDVAHIRCSWNEWADPHRKRQQQTEIHRILTAESVQWWKCWECHHVQRYRITGHNAVVVSENHDKQVVSRGDRASEIWRIIHEGKLTRKEERALYEEYQSLVSGKLDKQCE